MEKSSSCHPETSFRSQPFEVSWLESSLKETLLPGKPWHQVYDKIGIALAQEIENQLRRPEQQQIMFRLLGQHFVQKHLSNYPGEPNLLSPANMSESDWHYMEQLVHTWLMEQCEKAIEHSGSQWEPDGDNTGMSPEMIKFVDDTYNLVFTEMEWMLARHDAAQNESNPDLDHSSATWRSTWEFLVRQRAKSVESKDLHLATRRGSAFQLKAKDEISLVPELKAPPLNSPQTEILGDSLCAIITADPKQMLTVCERLRGKLLPKTLRSLIWIDKLLKSQKNIHKANPKDNIDRAARERFGRAVERKVAGMKLRSATRSPISGLIENAVVEEYEGKPCMQVFATDEQMILESSKALNVLYVFNGAYEPYLILWLFPLQVAFKQTSPNGEHPYELAMYLHFLIQNLFPSWPEIFAMAEHVMSVLEAEDRDFFAHLQSCSKKNIIFDPKDFLVELIAREREQAQELYSVPAESEQCQHINKELLADPVIFLRKWMGEGFVNVLDLPAVMLIWDQLFMQDWNRKVMEDFSLSVLMLLRDPLLAADDYQSLRQLQR
ncbi:uncharacterized protein LOC106703128 [Latimeria chalumnae]|uniref:uncharacterized protein LOC106703128 n=1 Tax=Latimeria chalumnae TaxID=7897 RepID=UPI0006D924CD|nr:PREDICTED: uncharacterized protein LOC106703128 [Latimeria chalumnae]|eukprot:XP_014342730.1 PREDICTED: uncharacterized protein LOC106703128 [Latimeria chalumnae]